MLTNMNIDKAKLADLLYDAQDHLNDAIRLLDMYVRETGDSSAEAYIVDHLRIMASRNHNFLGRDLNIDDLIEALNEYEEEEAEDDETDVSHNPLNDGWFNTPIGR